MTPPRSLHIRVYWPLPAVSSRTSLVSVWFRKVSACGPLTTTSPMCEISKRPAAVRTAWCSSMMLVYCTGISQPPNSMSLPPSFWCASESGVRLSIKLFRVPRSAFRVCSAPFLRLDLFLRHFHFSQHQMLGELHQFVRAAGVENSVREIVNVFLDPFGGDAAAPSGPGILRVQPRAGDKEVELRVLQLQLVELVVEDDVVGRAHAVKNRDLRFQLALRPLAHEGPERRHARTARDADQ